MKVSVIAWLVFSVVDVGAMRLVVGAGEFDRIQTLVSVDAPADMPENPALKGPDGVSLPLQLGDDGKVSFVLPKLEANASATFELVSLDEAPVEQAKAVEVDGLVELSVAGKPVTSYVRKGSLPEKDIDPVFLRSGYLHPLVTPGGTVVTGDYPKEHPHHHGIWMAWTKAVVDGRETDFWNSAKRLGRVESDAVEHVWSGPVHAGLEAVHRHIDLSSGEPVAVLEELWVVRVFALADAEMPHFLVELVSEQRVAGNASLALPVYHYGGLGIRGLDRWVDKSEVSFLTSEGFSDRVEANSKAANWIHLGGKVDGGLAGVGVLGHPRNFRSPQPIRVHPEEPFVCFAPQVAGKMEIGHEGVYRSCFRFVVADGPVNKVLMERVWADFANPPSAAWQ